MRRGLIICAGLGGAVIGAAVLVWPRSAPMPDAAPSAPASPAIVPPPAAAPPPAHPAPAAPSAVDMRAAADAYAARSGVGGRVRDYADGAPSMPQAVRDDVAETLLEDIAAGEADGVLAGQQGAYLRGVVAAARYADDPSARGAALAEIAAAEAARRAALPPIDHGAAFDAYKAREAALIAEVQGRTTFPDGLSRSEYLRRELDRARIEAYGE